MKTNDNNKNTNKVNNKPAENPVLMVIYGIFILFFLWYIINGTANW